MAGFRKQKFADELQRNLAQIIDTRVKDPQKGFITITRVRMSPDLSLATINFTAVDNNGQPNNDVALEVLERASGFIRHEIGASMKMRIVPNLRFYVDESLLKRAHIESLIAEIHKDESPQPSEDEAEKDV
jgi:ribosome-binding factor A